MARVINASPSRGAPPGPDPGPFLQRSSSSLPPTWVVPYFLRHPDMSSGNSSSLTGATGNANSHQPASYHAHTSTAGMLSILTPGAQRRLWDFPNEIWIQIFEAVGNSADLLSVYRSCRLFRQLALEPMFEDLRFTRTHRALAVARVLDENPNLRRRVRTLEFRLTRSFDLENPGSSFVSMTEPYVARASDFDALLGRAIDLPNLSTVHLIRATVTPAVYNVLSALPRLETLKVIQCALAPLRVPAGAPSETHVLSSIRVKRLVYRRNRLTPSAHEGLGELLHPVLLTRLASLEELKADWDDSLSVPPWAPIQPQLRDVTLYVLDARAGTELRNLPLFLAARPNIATLRVEASDPAIRMTAATIPGLRKFIGAPGIARAVLPDSGTRTVDTTAYAAHVPNTIALLESCPRALADLRIALRMWDEEILYAVAQLLPDLERLEVWYHGGCPKDTFVMSLGTQLIPRMPRLKVLKVFPLPGAGGAADATDAARADDMHNESRWKPVQRGVFTRAQVRGFLSAWTRYCPALAEVKLAPSSYWVRDATGVDWECIGE